MAATFSISDGTNTINLTDSTGMHMLKSYVPSIAIPTGDGSIPPYVTEIIPILFQATSDDNLASRLQVFHILQKHAAEYWQDPTQATDVYLQCKLANETSTRRAFIRSLSFEFNNRLGGLYDAGPAVDNGRAGTLTIVRHPYWEITAVATGAVMGAPASGASISHNINNTEGDVGARIDQLTIDTGNAIPKIWVSIRDSEKHGTVANFINIWECEDAGFGLGTDAARAADATASPTGGGNTKVTVTPGTTTWASRLTCALAGVTANESDNYGLFLWLLRAKVTGGTWEVKLRFGYERVSAGNYVETLPFELTSTSWNFYESAVQSIPMHTTHALTALGDGYQSTFRFQVWARRTVAGGNLDLDCFCPVTLDRGYLIVDGEQFVSGANIQYGMSPEDEGIMLSDDSAALSVVEVPRDHSFYIPNVAGTLYMSYQRNGSSTIGDTMQIVTNKYWPRWLSLRGAE